MSRWQSWKCRSLQSFTWVFDPPPVLQFKRKTMKISKCKFCGFTKPKIEPYTGPKFRVECAKCGSFSWMRKTREEAAEAWKTDPILTGKSKAA